MYPSIINHRKYKIGFTRLETISIVVISCILFGYFFSWYSTLGFGSKKAEVENNLKLIFDAEVFYFEHSQPPPSKSANKNDEGNEDPISNKQFLPLLPQPATPSSKSQIGNFIQGDWSLLNIKIKNPTYFSYSVEISGRGSDSTFRAIAKGDLDGDGHFSRWEMVGRINPAGQIIGKDLIYSLDPTE